MQDIRAELERLGYLRTSLDRLVLAGTRESDPARASLRVAVRVGALSALLGGLLFALTSQVSTNAPTAPRDTLIVSLYVALLVGVIASAVAFASGLLANLLARTFSPRVTQRLPLILGATFAALGFAYLTLWIRAHAVAADRPHQLFAGLVALLIAAFLGRLGMLTVAAVLSAGRAIAPAVPLRRGERALLASALIALIVATLVFVLKEDSPTASPAEVTVVPTGMRVRVVAIDGFEAALAEQLMQSGEMPNLERLRNGGAHARLAPEPERVPVIVWTTIATGRAPSAHGIRSAALRRLPGTAPLTGLDQQGWMQRGLSRALDGLRLTETAPATGAMRSVKTFWNVASEAGLRVGVVNWWATWPAESVNGYLVSDRAWLKIERGEPCDRDVFPATLYPLLQGVPRISDSEPGDRIDHFVVQAARLLGEKHPADLEILYLPGLDILSTQLLSESGGSNVASLDERVQKIRSYYHVLDGWIGLLAQRSSDQVFMMIADPGRVGRRSSREGDGLWMAEGRHIQAGNLEHVQARDIAPTLMHMIGLPISSELEGDVLKEAFTRSFQKAHPIRHISQYGRRPRSVARDDRYEDEVMRELRSLGYVQ